MVRRLLILALLSALIGVGAAAEKRLHALESAGPAGSHLLYLPSGKYLKALAPGFREAFADVIYLWSIQYYSAYEAADRYAYLDHIYRNVISELDPQYQDPYLIGAMIMALEARDVEMGLRLLDKGMEANPDNWLFPLEAGFYCYDTLRDYPRAARYFERAMKAPGAHPLIRRLHAAMYEKMGDRRSSLRYWAEILDTAQDEYVRSVAYRHVHDLRIQVDLETLEEAVGIYRQANGAWPPRLEALVAARIVARLPIDPEGNPYLYNRNTGEVRSVAQPLLRQLPR